MQANGVDRHIRECPLLICLWGDSQLGFGLSTAACTDVNAAGRHLFAAHAVRTGAERPALCAYRQVSQKVVPKSKPSRARGTYMAVIKGGQVRDTCVVSCGNLCGILLLEWVRDHPW